MVYTYNKTLEIIQEMGGSDLYNTFNNIISDKIDKTDLMINVLNIISDQTPYSNISDDTRYKLVLALKTHFDTVWFIVNVNNAKIDRLINGMYEDVYYINAYNGIRVATQSEVENGVVSLIEKRKWVLGERGEEIYKQFNIMMWSVTGRLKYYSAAGLHYTWGDDGPVETYFQLLSKSTPIMKELYAMLREEGEFDRIVALLNKSIKKGKFKYPNFAVDEVKVDLSVRQLIFNADKILWGYEHAFNSKKLLTRIKKDSKFKPTPLDISKLREDYQKATSVSFKGVEQKTDDVLDSRQLDVKNKCEIIEKAIKDGKLKEDDFGGKVAETLKKNNYRYCSNKQYDILISTTNKLDTTEDRGKKDSKIMTDVPDDMTDVYNVLDALGKGTLSID